MVLLNKKEVVMRMSLKKRLFGIIGGIGLLWLLLNPQIINRVPEQVWAVSKTGGLASDGSDLTQEKIKEMNDELKRDGYTFEVGINSVAKRDFAKLCGTRPNHENYLKAMASEGLPASKITLPSKFDWRDYNGLTPVRDQGNCGSCWAFATVGPLEANIKIKDQQTVDLSEQYLVSCNSNGWGCNGGFWPHSMLLKGMAVEKDFPYRAADVACRSVSTSYKIDKWGYVGYQNSIPSTSAIKTAIYQYGPVTVAVCADRYFDAYKSGVFNRSASGQTNHAVVLVGWDDSQNCWIMRNSWGKSWGESGYMRIAYGTSKIGEDAAYIVYKGGVTPPASAAPIRTPAKTSEATSTPQQSPDNSNDNLLLNQSVQASGELYDYVASNAVDGDYDTRWATSSNYSTQWIAVNLKRSCSNGTLKITWSNTNYARTYQLQGWNNSRWITLKTVTGNGGEDVVQFSNSSSISKIRINCTRQASSYYLIYEMELYSGMNRIKK
jgi:C1A family cysteine protease